MKRVVCLTLVLLMMMTGTAFSGSTAKNIVTNTQVNGAVANTAVGNFNEQENNIGSVKLKNSNVGNIVTNTKVNGAVANTAVGNFNKQKNNIGSVTAE